MKTKKKEDEMRARRIVRAVFFALGIALTALVCTEWYRQDCGLWSLIAAAFWNLGSTLVIWFTIDQALKEANE